MWQIRRPLYQSCADFIIDNTGDIQAAVQGIMEGFYEAAGD